MKLEIYTVRDRATDQYNNPMFLQSTGQAIRMFSDEINRAEDNNPLYKHPEDYDLYNLGTYDTATGLFNTGVPKQVAVGKDHLIKPNGK